MRLPAGRFGKVSPIGLNSLTLTADMFDTLGGVDRAGHFRGQVMRSYRPLALAAFAAITLSGCQTYFGGMTLPSPHYLKHSPQYFPPDPTFPLQREADSMTAPEATARTSGAVGAPVTPAVPPGMPK